MTGDPRAIGRCWQSAAIPDRAASAWAGASLARVGSHHGTMAGPPGVGKSAAIHTKHLYHRCNFVSPTPGLCHPIQFSFIPMHSNTLVYSMLVGPWLEL